MRAASALALLVSGAGCCPAGLRPAEAELRPLFDRINRDLFDGAVEAELYWFDGPGMRGCYLPEGHLCAATGRPVILIRRRLTGAELTGALAHEMIHAARGDTGHGGDHGPAFLREARRAADRLGLPVHVVR